MLRLALSALGAANLTTPLYHAIDKIVTLTQTHPTPHTHAHRTNMQTCKLKCLSALPSVPHTRTPALPADLLRLALSALGAANLATVLYYTRTFQPLDLPLEMASNGALMLLPITELLASGGGAKLRVGGCGAGVGAQLRVGSHQAEGRWVGG